MRAKVSRLFLSAARRAMSVQSSALVKSFSSSAFKSFIRIPFTQRRKINRPTSKEVETIFHLQGNQASDCAYEWLVNILSIAMPLAKVLERVARLIRDTNETTPQTSSARAQERPRDESSMADFVRILQ